MGEVLLHLFRDATYYLAERNCVMTETKVESNTCWVARGLNRLSLFVIDIAVSSVVNPLYSDPKVFYKQYTNIPKCNLLGVKLIYNSKYWATYINHRQRLYLNKLASPFTCNKTSRLLLIYSTLK